MSRITNEVLLPRANVNQVWQDRIRDAMIEKGEETAGEGRAYRAEKENFPKLWISRRSATAESTESILVYFSPRYGKVYTNAANPPEFLTQIPVDKERELHNEHLIIPSESNLSVVSTTRSNGIPIYWKETEVDQKRQSCEVYVHFQNEERVVWWDFDKIEEVGQSPELRIFSVGSPLRGRKLTTARYGAYSSLDFGDPGIYGLFGPLVDLALSAVTSIFGTSRTVPEKYGYSSYYDSVEDLTENQKMSLPTCLQGRGDLFPSLERITLKNAKKPYDMQEVYHFRTSRNENTFFKVEEARPISGSELLQDMPNVLYLMENPQAVDDATDKPCVLGIGQNTARIHMFNNSTYEVKILSDSELFDTETLELPIKERYAREKETWSTNMHPRKFEKVIEEIASQVSYKTICTMMEPVSLDGKDLTMKFNHEVHGEVQEVRLVLYVVQKKYVKYLEKIGNNQITHLVGMWADTDLVDAYWASTEETLPDSLHLLHDVKKVIQIGEVLPGITSPLIRADLDVTSPDNYFFDILGDFGAAFRLAAVEEFKRNKNKSSNDLTFGSTITDIANVTQTLLQSGFLGETAQKVASTGVIGSLANQIFGLSQTEPSKYIEMDVDSGQSIQEQPYVNLKFVLDQEQRDTCVICSICHAISMLAEVKSGEKGTDFQRRITTSVLDRIPVSSVPRGGLVITDTLEKLEDMLEDIYNLRFFRMTPNVTSIKNALGRGLPVIVGTKFDMQLFQYSNNLDEPISGPMFAPGDYAFMHCVTIVAYDDADSTFTVLNSYSSSWGRNGAMIMEQDYRGFDRAFVLEHLPAQTFGAIDVSPNLPSAYLE